jgi:hypothetical protein
MTISTALPDSPIESRPVTAQPVVSITDSGQGRQAKPLMRSRSDRSATESTRDWLAGHRVSVVIPALDEAENLPHVLPRIPKWVHEVLLVDGRSTDDTVAVAHALWPSIRIVEQEGRGKGAALRSGFAASTGDMIVMLDADGSTAPEEIPAFVGTLLAGADFAKGSRFMQGGGSSDISLYRALGNRGLLALVKLLFGGRYSDLCYGYNAFWRRVLPKLDLDADGFEIETEMNVRALRAGLTVAEVPSFEADRIHGTSRLNPIRDGIRVLRTIGQEWYARLRERWQEARPAQATGQAGNPGANQRSSTGNAAATASRSRRPEAVGRLATDAGTHVIPLQGSQDQRERRRTA